MASSWATVFEDLSLSKVPDSELSSKTRLLGHGSHSYMRRFGFAREKIDEEVPIHGVSRRGRLHE